MSTRECTFNPTGIEVGRRPCCLPRWPQPETQAQLQPAPRDPAVSRGGGVSSHTATHTHEERVCERERRRSRHVVRAVAVSRVTRQGAGPVSRHTVTARGGGVSCHEAGRGPCVTSHSDCARRRCLVSRGPVARHKGPVSTHRGRCLVTQSRRGPAINVSLPRWRYPGPFLSKSHNTTPSHTSNPAPYALMQPCDCLIEPTGLGQDQSAEGRRWRSGRFRSTTSRPLSRTRPACHVPSTLVTTS